MPVPLDRVTRLLRQLPQADPLTEREREVVGLLAEALTNREIADRFVLSERTVESHVRDILAKLDFTTRSQVTARALRKPRIPR